MPFGSGLDFTSPREKSTGLTLSEGDSEERIDHDKEFDFNAIASPVDLLRWQERR